MLFICFHISQNQGNSEAIAKAIENIPFHCFNEHSNCGSWCGYNIDPENYFHTNIGDGFQSDVLFEALKDIFSNLASKSSQFICGASSNANESLNAMIVSKAPKTRLYGKTASSDIRVACAVNKKNIGEQYCINLAERLNVSPGKHSINCSEKVDCFSSKRYAKSITRAAKLKHLSLKKRKSELKNKNEAIEGITYESHIRLLSAVPELMQTTMINDNTEPICIFFDLETGGFSKTCDIIH